MKAKFLFILIFVVFGNGCFQRSKRETIELNCHLYIERFNINPFGVDEIYLTDSLNFRVYVGKYDVEHQTFTFVCKENNIMIYKKAEDNHGIWRKVDSLFLSRDSLMRNKIDSSKPLFIFK
jgi:hypothetical protein